MTHEIELSYRYWSTEPPGRRGERCRIVSRMGVLSAWVVVEFADGAQARCNRGCVRRAQT